MAPIHRCPEQKGLEDVHSYQCAGDFWRCLLYYSWLLFEFGVFDLIRKVLIYLKLVCCQTASCYNVDLSNKR
jgi:hypothetical protein